MWEAREAFSLQGFLRDTLERIRQRGACCLRMVCSLSHPIRICTSFAFCHTPPVRCTRTREQKRNDAKQY